MKKIILILLDILTLAFCAAVYVFRYFTRRKLGMVRWLNYNTKVYLEKLPLDVLKIAAIIIAVAAAVLLIWGYIKKKRTISVKNKMMLLPMVIVVSAYAYITLCYSYPAKADYYFIMPFIGAAAFAQLLRCVIAMYE